MNQWRVVRRYLEPWAMAAALSLAAAVNPMAASGQSTEPPAQTTPPPAQAAPAATQEPATYVGSEDCATCHEEVFKTWEHNPHHGSQVDGNPAGPTVTCESCHGPASLHVAAEGDQNDPRFATLRNFKKMKPDEAAAVCQSCHKTGVQMYWDQSAHARNDVACQSCHSMHNPASVGGKALLAMSRPTEVCLGCHQEKRVEINRTAHMPVREGAMDCTSCHNPHGSVGPHMIRAVSNNELCTTCHMDKRGPMLWEHPPVRENCVTCHMPHGANNDKVLASKRPFLCQRCHIASRHPSDLYDATDFASNRLMNRSCTNCHSQIHGSNHPSGKTFLR